MLNESPLMTDTSTELEESVMKIRYGDSWQVWPFIIVKDSKFLFMLDVELHDLESDTWIRRTHIVGRADDLLHMCTTILSNVISATILIAPTEKGASWISKRLVSIEGIHEYNDEYESYPAYFITEDGERISDQVIETSILKTGDLETLWQQSTNHIQPVGS